MSVRTSRAVISVLLPFRDAAATIDAALASVLAEPEVDEVVAVDDSSSDDSPSRVAEHARKDTRVRLVASRGRGVAATLQTAVDLARGDLLARMDADDISLPGRVRRAAETLRSDATLGAVGTRVALDGATGEGMERYVTWQNALVTPDDHRRELFVESPLCHPSVVVRRAALSSVGGYRECAWPEDWDLWLRLDAAGWAMAKVPEALFVWTHRAERVTFTDPRCALERLTDARARYLPARLESIARGRDLAVWGAGRTGRQLARALEAHGLRARLFIDIDPRKIGRIARGARIVGASELDRTRHVTLVAVGARGARALVRGHLTGRGFIEGVDWLAAS